MRASQTSSHTGKRGELPFVGSITNNHCILKTNNTWYLYRAKPLKSFTDINSILAQNHEAEKYYCTFLTHLGPVAQRLSDLTNATQQHGGRVGTKHWSPISQFSVLTIKHNTATHPPSFLVWYSETYSSLHEDPILHGIVYGRTLQSAQNPNEVSGTWHGCRGLFTMNHLQDQGLKKPPTLIKNNKSYVSLLRGD